MLIASLTLTPIVKPAQSQSQQRLPADCVRGPNGLIYCKNNPPSYLRFNCLLPDSETELVVLEPYIYNCCPEGTTHKREESGVSGVFFYVACVEKQKLPSEEKPPNVVYLMNVDDNLLHTLTSGSPDTATPDGKFDTGFVAPGKTVKMSIIPSGPAFCSLHPYEDAYANFKIVGAPVS